MTLWILNHYAVTPEMGGGTRHYDFAKELVKRGYKVTIFASSFHYARHKELKLTKSEKWKIENVDGINFVWIKTFPYQKNDWRRVLNMFSFTWKACFFGKKITKLNRNIEEPNVIIGSSVHLLAVLAAYFLAEHYQAKFIMEVRDLWPQTMVDLGKLKENSLIVKILRILEKFLYKKARKIIVISPLFKNYIIPLGIAENKIICISNGIDLSLYNIGKFILSDNIQSSFYKGLSRKVSTFRDNKKTERDAGLNFFTVMYSGTFAPVNALNTLLETAKIIRDNKDIRFILIGNGSEKQNLIEYKEKLGLQNIEFRSLLPKNQLPKMLAKADMFIVHFKKSNVYKYGISFNKLFDYMAIGKPIIFAVSAPTNPVDKSGCGITIAPENPEVMAEVIIKIYQMPPKEREKMGQKGRDYVEKYHSIPVLVDKLGKVIKEVIHEKTISNED